MAVWPPVQLSYLPVAAAAVAMGLFVGALFVVGEQSALLFAVCRTGAGGEGPYVDGELNGHWVFRFADGDVEEGPYNRGVVIGPSRTDPAARTGPSARRPTTKPGSSLVAGPLLELARQKIFIIKRSST